MFFVFSMGDTHFMAMKQWGQPCDLVSDYPMVKQSKNWPNWYIYRNPIIYIFFFGGNSHGKNNGLLHMSLKSIYVFSILI